MAVDRRELLSWLGCAAMCCVGEAEVEAAGSVAVPVDPYAVLVDTTACIGCRKCEWACNRESGLPVEPLKSLEDRSVFGELRRPDAGHYTVVNRFQRENGDGRPLYVKVQCMHCNDPTCYSACLVTAFSKSRTGAVVYEPSRCMGCRYCIVSCPFQVPAYEYSNAFTPRVRKCTFCSERIAREGGVPACVEVCPPQCLSFGRRSVLLELAHLLIEEGNGKYVDHVYGEHEMGGTNWLYITGAPFEKLGFRTDLGTTAAPKLTSGALAAVPAVIGVWPALLGGIYLMTRSKERVAARERTAAVNEATQVAKAAADQAMKGAMEKAKAEKEKAVESAVKKALAEAAKAKGEEGA